MTMLTSWKLDPYTVMRLNSGRRGDDVLKGGHLACSSHKPLTSSYSPERLQAGQDLGLRIVYPTNFRVWIACIGLARLLYIFKSRNSDILS